MIGSGTRFGEGLLRLASFENEESEETEGT